MNQLFKNLKIRSKVSVIIFITVVFLLIIAALNYMNSSANMERAVHNEMSLTLDKTAESVLTKLNLHSQMMLSTKSSFEAKSEFMTREEAKKYFEKVLPINQETFGMGIWFNTNILNEYFGPYAYKEGNEIVYTTVYEDADYDYPSTDWYQLGLDSSDVVWTTPYFDEALQQTFITAAVQITRNSVPIGVISGDYVLNSIQEIVSDVKIGDSGYAFLVDSDGLFLTHPDINKVNSTTIEEYLSISVEQITQEDGSFTAEIDGESYIVHYQKIAGMPWKVVLIASVAEMYAPLQKSLTQQILISGLLLLLIVATMTIINKYITNGIDRINNQLGVLSTGDLTKHVVVDSKDEFGEMATSYNTTIDSLNHIMNNIHYSSETVAATSEQLTASVSEVHTSITSVATSMTEMTENSANQYEMNELLNKLTVNITENMEKFSETLQTVVESSLSTVKAATNGASQVHDFISEITHLHGQVEASAELIVNLKDESQKIEMMSTLISSIADQTNLLSLNAAIEAARAGESGKGFAVVAGEVKKLAEQTGDTSNEIAAMVRKIQTEIASAVAMMGKSKEIAESGIVSVQQTGIIFEDIEASINNLKQMIDVTNKHTAQVFSELQAIASIVNDLRAQSATTNEHTLSISAITEEQSATMAEMADASEQLAQLAQTLQLEVARFQTAK
ncbi:methyl-accepting chemotaxis protein [Metasolibacillus fluoroglycofenilyticus]|uniref:methyl-accepting chemotaxis protein n=1 Tax=Metasolibacillus fluoroglycofenilyticus TaxID=1239396 RepID=UPI00137A64D6|nr:methyl-accepting chemotaxis protein [Metasolibacillus fluoroglycofenilyticus]